MIIILTAVSVVVVTLIIYGYYMIDSSSPDEESMQYTDTYIVRDHKRGVVKMNKHMMVVGKVVGGRRVGMEVPMVRSTKAYSDVDKVEPVVPVIAIPQQHPSDSDLWLYMRMVQQWKHAGRKGVE
jgi:hypothetical protein